MQTDEKAQPLGEADGETMDYDELTLNAGITEYDGDVPGGEGDAKNKSRRIWTTKEEEVFYDIWGRQNWRLTQHGKNMTHFAQWAIEMKERCGFDIKPQEIQTKVNQARSKFRQVMKQLSMGKVTIRWKKFHVIDKILRNQYRPADAEPIPIEALEHNRDFPDGMEATKSNPKNSQNPLNAIKQGELPAPTSDLQQYHGDIGQFAESNSAGNGNGIECTVVDVHNYNPPLVANNLVDIKEEIEYAADNCTSAQLYPYQHMQQQLQQQHFEQHLMSVNSNHQHFDQPQHSMQQDTKDDSTNAYNNANYTFMHTTMEPLMHQTTQPTTALDGNQVQNQQQLQQQQEQQLQDEQQQQQQQHHQYVVTCWNEQNEQTVAVETSVVVPSTITTNTTQTQNNQCVNNNNNNNNNNHSRKNNLNHSVNVLQNPLHNGANTINCSNTTTTNISAKPTTATSVIMSAGKNNMANFPANTTTKLATPLAEKPTPRPAPVRKRRMTTMSRPKEYQQYQEQVQQQPIMHKFVPNSAPPADQEQVQQQPIMHEFVPNSAPPADPIIDVEKIYLNEVRKRNFILGEQREIARKRMLLEERKIALMESFFPKCLKIQEQIMDHFMRQSHNATNTHAKSTNTSTSSRPEN